MSDQLLDFGEDHHPAALTPTITTTTTHDPPHQQQQQTNTTATGVHHPFRTEITNLQQKIHTLQNELYALRFCHAVDDVNEWREEIRKKLTLLRRMEDELSELRIEEMRQFKRDLDLSSIEGLEALIELPVVATSSSQGIIGGRKRIDSFKGKSTLSTSVSSSSLLESRQRKRSNSNLSTSSNTSGTSTGEHNGLKKWSSVIAVATAANKWKNTWETNKMNRAQTILTDGEKSPTSQLTKDQILELRSTLFRLKQKKQLTLKEKLLMESLSNRLRNLDKHLIDRSLSRRYLDEMDSDDEQRE